MSRYTERTVGAVLAVLSAIGIVALRIVHAPVLSWNVLVVSLVGVIGLVLVTKEAEDE